jgi:hypothetical protein
MLEFLAMREGLIGGVRRCFRPASRHRRMDPHPEPLSLPVSRYFIAERGPAGSA